MYNTNKPTLYILNTSTLDNMECVCCCVIFTGDYVTLTVALTLTHFKAFTSINITIDAKSAKVCRTNGLSCGSTFLNKLQNFNVYVPVLITND